jgi:ribose transport system permease protein
MSVRGRILAALPDGFWLMVIVLVGLVVAPVAGQGDVNAATFMQVSTSFANAAPLAVAIGLTMIAGEFDISTVAMFSLGSMIFVRMGGAPLPLAVLVAALVGMIGGIVQSTVMIRFKVNSVPLTLAGYLVLWGLNNQLGHGQFAVGTPSSFGTWLSDAVGGVTSNAALLTLVIALAIGAVERRTRVGTLLRAVGGDRRASRISGVPVVGVLVGAFVAAGLIAALGGVIYGATYSSASPDVAFSPLVNAVIAAVLGGAGTRGRGSVLGIVCGVLTLSLLQQALLVLGLDPNYLVLITGAFLVVVSAIGTERGLALVLRLVPRRAPEPSPAR